MTGADRSSAEIRPFQIDIPHTQFRTDWLTPSIRAKYPILYIFAAATILGGSEHGKVLKHCRALQNTP